MIATTVFGTIYPLVSTAQKPQFQADAVGYMREIRDIQMGVEYNAAIVDHIQQTAEKCQEFSEYVIKISTWYEPPKGMNIDAWA